MFKVGDKVVLTNGEKWVDKSEYKKIARIVAEGVYKLTRHEESGEGGAFWYDRELELYEEEVESVVKIYDSKGNLLGVGVEIKKSGEAFEGKAKCRLQNWYESQIGFRIANARAEIKKNEYIIRGEK